MERRPGIQFGFLKAEYAAKIVFAPWQVLPIRGTPKASRIEGFQCAGKADAVKRAASGKCVIADFFQPLRQHDIVQTIAAGKCGIANLF